MQYFFLAVISVFFMTSTASADVRPGKEWVALGELVAARGAQTDVIATQGAQPFRELKLCVSNAPIGIRGFSVVFGNGDEQFVRIRSRFPRNECSREITLYGDQRQLDSVVLEYRGRNDGPRADVAIWAR